MKPYPTRYNLSQICCRRYIYIYIYICINIVINPSFDVVVSFRLFSFNLVLSLSRLVFCLVLSCSVLSRLVSPCLVVAWSVLSYCIKIATGCTIRCSLNSCVLVFPLLFSGPPKWGALAPPPHHQDGTLENLIPQECDLCFGHP